MLLLRRIKSKTSSIFLRSLSPFINIWEERQFPVPRDSAPDPIFIVGAPRTGSTILYQALTNVYQFAYIDNTACAWYRNLRFGLWLSQRKYGSKPHNNFKAEHGNTQKFGGHAPSECGHFWYRWLPQDRHFIDHHEVTDSMVAGIRNEILGASAYLNKPLLFKNLNAGQRLRLIHRCFPNAKIIFVRRDPRFVIRSILRGRKKVGIGKSRWWGIMPKNFKNLLSLPEDSMCAAQVYYLEKQIEDDLSLFPSKNVQEVHYNELEEHLIHDIGAWAEAKPRVKASIPTFKKDNLDQLTSLELNDLNRLVKLYAFKEGLFL